MAVAVTLALCDRATGAGDVATAALTDGQADPTAKCVDGAGTGAADGSPGAQSAERAATSEPAAAASSGSSDPPTAVAAVVWQQQQQALEQQQRPQQQHQQLKNAAPPPANCSTASEDHVNTRTAGIF